MRGLSSGTEDASKNHQGELKERKNICDRGWCPFICMYVYMYICM